MLDTHAIRIVYDQCYVIDTGELLPVQTLFQNTQYDTCSWIRCAQKDLLQQSQIVICSK